jgi:hypothetical protein
MRTPPNKFAEEIYLFQLFVRGEWLDWQPNATDTGEPRDWSNHPQNTAPFAREFSACGDVWQKTGIHGTQSREIALKAFSAIANTNPSIRFRMVHRRYDIHTTSIAEAPGIPKEGSS